MKIFTLVVEIIFDTLLKYIYIDNFLFSQDLYKMYGDIFNFETKFVLLKSRHTMIFIRIFFSFFLNKIGKILFI